jgi:hypothetical protein
VTRHPSLKKNRTMVAGPLTTNISSVLLPL